MTHIKNLLQLFEGGLINGAGNNVNHFCVQQAVHRVIDDALDDATKSDHPPSWCVKDTIVGFGIHLNDYPGWTSNKARAEGLKRFAIAELGSNKINSREFHKRLAEKVAAKSGMSADGFSKDINIIQEFVGGDGDGPFDSTLITKRLTWIANAAAYVLMELETEGSQFLEILDEKDPEVRKEKARNLGGELYAKQLAETSYKWGTDSSFGLPIQKHGCHVNIEKAKSKAQ